MKEFAAQEILRVEKLTKIYGPSCPNCIANTGPDQETNQCRECGSIVACADISFAIHQGEILGIVGESGSGKSTIIRCLYFDYEITSGKAYFLNYNQTDNAFQLSLQKKRYLRNYLLGMVYQHPHLGLRLDFTAGGNIAERSFPAAIFTWAGSGLKRVNCYGTPKSPWPEWMICRVILAVACNKGSKSPRRSPTTPRLFCWMRSQVVWMYRSGQSAGFNQTTATRVKYVDDCRFARFGGHPVAYRSDRGGQKRPDSGDRPDRSDFGRPPARIYATFG